VLKLKGGSGVHPEPIVKGTEVGSKGYRLMVQLYDPGFNLIRFFAQATEFNPVRPNNIPASHGDHRDGQVLQYEQQDSPNTTQLSDLQGT
jgi:hypothetical protein